MGSGQADLASQHNDRRDDSRASSFLFAHQMLGSLALSTVPTNGQVVPIVINGTTITITAVTSIGSTANNVLIGGSAAAFVTNLVNFLRRPDQTTSTQVAASGANQTLLQYVGWAWPGSSTNIVPFSLNKNVNGIANALTSFNITGITVTSGTWTAKTLALYVEDGTYYIGGVRYFFLGGATGTVTAPVSNPRIDVLTIDNTGALNWTTGTENASPSAPAYPANQVPLVELYNVVSETILTDLENQQNGQGYISNDVRPSMSYGIPFGAVPDSILPAATNTYSLGSSSYEWENIYGQAIYNNGSLVAATRFGGTGADGALSITSGTTTFNAGSANVFIKNYSSISITGTGLLNFSSPHANGTNIILKSSGNVTITSSANPCIDIGSMGTAGGSAGSASGTTNSLGSYGAGGSNIVNQGSSGQNPSNSGTNGGSSNTAYGIGNYLTGAPSALGQSLPSIYLLALGIETKQIMICPATGGAGSGGSNQSGTGENGHIGGAGAGSLYIECAGALNLTGIINGNGVAGGANVNGVSREVAGSGGGGGIVLIVYNILTANSGIINLNGGAAGTQGSGQPGNNGANGASLITKNTVFS